MFRSASGKRRSFLFNVMGGRTGLFVLYSVFLLVFVLQLLTAHLIRVAGGNVPQASGDFVALSIGGYIVRHGNGPQLYDLEMQTQAQKALLGQEAEQPSLSDGLALYVYPPFVAWLFAGLTALSPSQAYLLWTGMNILLLMATAYSLTVLPGLASRRARLLTGLAVVTFFPAVMVLIKGQLSFLVLTSLTAAFLSLRKGRDGLAGLWLGLGLVKPQLVAAPILILVYRRRWRAVLAFGIVVLWLVVISLTVVGPAGLMDYIRLLWQVGRETSNDSLVHPVYMLSWRGMVTRGAALLAKGGLSIPQPFVLGSYALLSLLSLGILLRVWRQPWADSLKRLESLWAFTVVIGMLISPHLHIYDLSLLILVGLLMAGVHQLSRPRWQELFGLGHAAPVLTFPMGRVIQAQVCGTVMVLIAGVLWYHIERGTTEIAVSARVPGHRFSEGG